MEAIALEPKYQFTETRPSKPKNKFIEVAKNYAGIIDSRESITRLILDLFAFDIPTIAAAATRNWASLMEGFYEAGVSTGTLLIAPTMTKILAKLGSFFFLDKEEQKHYDKLTRFYRTELKDQASFEKGLERIINEEPRDIERISTIYKTLGKEKQSQKFHNQASDLKEYFSKVKFSPEKIKKLMLFKEFAITAESCFEGLLWGGFGLGLRWFRKNILKQDSFTGTKAYLSEEEKKKLGQTKPLSLIQKIGGGTASIMAPFYNSFLMKLCRDPQEVKKSKLLSIIDKNLDMTHGLFPKLGLLFSYTTVPKWFSALFTVQGKDEFIERILKLCTIIPSWWLGHRVTNGWIAKFFDKQLAKKYNTQPGILLEQSEVGKAAPEPAKIHHVLESTNHNPELQKEARDKHAITLYSGLALHSFGVFLITLLINQITKWRVTRKLNK